MCFQKKQKQKKKNKEEFDCGLTINKDKTLTNRLLNVCVDLKSF